MTILELSFHFRLPKLAQAAVKEEAKRLGISPSAYVRALVIAALTGRGKNGGVAHSALHSVFSVEAIASWKVLEG